MSTYMFYENERVLTKDILKAIDSAKAEYGNVFVGMALKEPSGGNYDSKFRGATNVAFQLGRMEARTLHLENCSVALKPQGNGFVLSIVGECWRV